MPRDAGASRGTAERRAPSAESRWRVVAASVAGAGHARAGLPCQDAHHWAVAADGTLVAAVADGAGSAALGGVGARVAAQAAVRAAVRALPAAAPDEAALRAALGGALGAARAAAEAEAEARAAALPELATTLIVVAALPGGDAVAAMQVGDGAAVCADARGALHALTSPRHGEYVNETVFLTTPGAVEEAQWGWWQRPGGERPDGERPDGEHPDGERSDGGPPAAHVAVLSDGLQMLALAMPAGAPHAPFFTPLLRYAAGSADPDTAAAGLATFLRGPRVAARTDDDVTLLLAARGGAC